MRTSRFQKRLVLLAGLGLCMIPIAAALSWHQIVLRYHLYHLSHGQCPYRDSAFQYLLRRNGAYAEASMRVDEIVVLPQKDGGNVLAIFQPDDDDDLKGERTTWLFDPESTLILLR
jgi:hypothetical protein